MSVLRTPRPGVRDSVIIQPQEVGLLRRYVSDPHGHIFVVFPQTMPEMIGAVCARYLARKQADQMRADRHPDLIISARGDWAEGCPPGAVEVTTADGKVHSVTAESYDASRLPLTLLSKCIHYPVRGAASRTGRSCR
jgi:hypothetical protein